MASELDVIAVLTTRSVAQILADQGLTGVTVDARKARQCRFLVCVRSSQAPEADWDHPSGSAFLVGRLAGQASVRDGESLVRFNEVARVEAPFAWKGGTHPVHYTSFEDLGIVASNLRFEDVPDLGKRAFAIPVPGEAPVSNHSTPIKPLTLQAAKQGLSLMFGVEPEQIEITIKG
jgi:hypothetical protein